MTQKTRKVIKRSNFPRKFPVMPTIVAAMGLKLWNAPGWVCGVAWTLAGILWLSIICDLVIYSDEEVDLFENK